MRNNINTKIFFSLNQLDKQKIIILFLIIIFAVTIGSFSGCEDNPVDSGKPKNRRPVISSVVMFPEVVGPSDSLIVICNASDPDGDSLVYDWYSLSGSIIKIKGAHPRDMARYNTHQNAQIFYAPESRFVDAPQDTFGLQCAVRDGKGGGDVSVHLRFIVIKDS